MKKEPITSKIENLSFFSDLPLIVQQSLLREIVSPRAEIWLPPEVLNPNLPEDTVRLQKIALESSNLVPESKIQTPFDSAVREFLQLRSYYQNHLDRLGLQHTASTEEITTHFSQLFKTMVLKEATLSGIEIDINGLDKLVSESGIFTDVASLVNEIMGIDVTDDFSEQARFIWDSNLRQLSLYVSEDIDSILKKSRSVGLIPFETREKLRSMKIVVLGASVAASTVDLLVALGARDIEFIDDGELDPSNGQKMPSGATADINSNGRSKVHALASSLYQRNPYGKFTARKGLVVMTDELKRAGSEDQTLEDMITDDTGLVIEVIDDARTKMQIRLEMQQKFPNIPILFIADVGINAFAGLEMPEQGEYFNQDLTEEEVSFLKTIAQEGYSQPTDPIKAIFMMVKDQLPDDHKLQVLLGRFGGIVPFLSQTAIAARQSSAIAAIDGLSHLGRAGSSGKNMTAADAPKSLIPPLSTEAQATLDKIFSIALH